MVTFSKHRFSPLALGWAVGTFALVAATIASAIPPPAAKTSAVSPLRFNQDVLPILGENCYSCHGPDSASRQAGLRLDKRVDALLLRGGTAAIVPGDPAKSEIIRRINGKTAIMPPAESHKTLTPRQIAILTRWVKEGAVYEPHWSYIAPKLPTLPKVKNLSWVQNPIDQFVLARLEKSGLAPAPEADRRTLARRVCLDLTGLPPTTAEVERFVADKSPDAYEKLVDQYLNRPAWGEHRGRYWLDAARYADTHGIHFDNYREMWSYRDWVINAFNRNMTFDKFSIEQLAGDLLPNPTLDQRIATGFNRCNITTNEGGAISEEYAVLYTRDRTDATAQVWMGTTAACAVCHDHKFDPLSQKEFYALSAFFNNTTQRPMDGNIKDTPPIVPVPNKKDMGRWAALGSERKGAMKATEARKAAARPDFDRWMVKPDVASAITADVPTNGMVFQASLSEGAGNTVAATHNGKPVTLTAASVSDVKEPGWIGGQTALKAFQRKKDVTFQVPEAGDWEKDQSFSYAAWINLPAGNAGGALVSRMDEKQDYQGWDMWVEGNRIATHIVHKWPQDALKIVTKDAVTAGKWHHVCVTYNGGAKKESVTIYVDGVAQTTTAAADSLKSTIRTSVPFKIGQRSMGSGIEGAGIQDVRLYGRALSSSEAAHLAQGTRAGYLASRKTPVLTPMERNELFGWWLSDHDAPYRVLMARQAVLDREDGQIRMRGTVAYVAQEQPKPAMAYVLNRGEYDQRKDKVMPGTPAALPPMPKDFPRNRLGFARWLFLPSHPLTARVTVNRFWQEVFGQGLVRTTGDFGVSGETPSHPELLDWLAVDFRDHGWDVKRFFKQVVMSAAYRQSAAVTPRKKSADPDNRLLSRGPRFRMDAEMIRDYALASSGLLKNKIGGPSVKPYQPEGIWEAVAMIGSNTREYKQDSGDALYRRSMYTFWKRSALLPTLDIFNAPTRETCTVRRERTNTPIQALVTLNDVQFVEAARALAVRTLKQAPAPTASARVDYMAQELLDRPLRPEEKAIVLKSAADLEGYYRAHPEDARQLLTVGDLKPDTVLKPEMQAAWTMLANQLMNLDEVLNK
jgi:mono/diheme cytochrome c family protein